jgi:hypothetical protein
MGFFERVGASIVGGAVSRVLQPFVDAWLKSKQLNNDKAKVESDADGAAYHTAITAASQSERDNIPLKQVLLSRWEIRVLMVMAALPPIVHSGAIYLDSTFCNAKFKCTAIGTWLGMPWHVAQAPGVYEGQELSIIASFFAYGVGMTAAGAFALWARRKG